MDYNLEVNNAVIFYNHFRLINPFGRKTPFFSINEDKKPFLILSAGRSGTTLLRSMINQHSSIVIPPESFVFSKIYKKYQIYKRAPWPDLVKIILGEFLLHSEFAYWKLNLKPAFDSMLKLRKNERSLFKIINSVFQLSCDENNKSNAIWGDKTPLNTYNLNKMESLFDGPKYINLTRDGRDVVASLQKSKLLSNTKDACDRWKDSITITNKFNQKHPDRILNIRYEDLVNSPEKELLNICNFLDVKFEKNMLSNNENVEQLGDSFLEHHQNLKKPINTTSVGKWMNYFEKEELRWVEDYMGEELKLMGYSLSGDNN